MNKIEERVRAGLNAIEPYKAGLTDDELKRVYGLDRVIKLNANENALGPSPLAIHAIREETSMLHHYPDGGSGYLKNAIAQFHGIDANHVLVGNGSDEIIKLISETFLEIDDEIVMPFPSFSQYSFGASVMRAKVVYVPLTKEFTYNVERMLQAVTNRTKLLYICTPNNPSGTVMTQSQLDWLLQELPEHVTVVLDLAYNDYSARKDRAVVSQELFREPRVIALHTFSKLYGLAGLRVGYALAHPELLAYVNRVREPFNVNRLAQRAAVAALLDEQHRKASVDLASTSKVRYLETAKKLRLEAPIPEGNFILLKTGDGPSVTKLLMERGVMVRTGFAGLPDHIRVTFGTDEENTVFLDALENVLKR